MTGQALLQVRHLHKSFGSQMAVNNVSFDVGAGELLAVIGPNAPAKALHSIWSMGNCCQTVAA